MKIIQLGDPILTKKSKEVENVEDDEIQSLIDGMLDTLNKNSDRSAGLSAPQVGYLHRICICNRFDLTKDEDKNIWEVMINPKIINKSKESSTVWEGCLSIKEGNLFGEVTRSKEIEFEFLDRDGNKKSLKADGFFSHVVQHEIDHLDGVLFLKYIDDPSNLYSDQELNDMISSQMEDEVPTPA
jgi:peptide deformylase